MMETGSCSQPPQIFITCAEEYLYLCVRLPTSRWRCAVVWALVFTLRCSPSKLSTLAPPPFPVTKRACRVTLGQGTRCRPGRMQNTVFNVAETENKREVKKQSKIKTKNLMCKGTREQAGIVVVVHQSEVINKKADGQAKVKNLAYRELGTEKLSAF